MKIGTATAAVAGVTAASITSTVLVHRYLGQGGEGNTNPQPNNTPPKPELEQPVQMEGVGGEGDGAGLTDTEQSKGALNSLFDVQKINRNSNARQLLNFDKGSCFSSFFPEAELSVPTETAKLNASSGSEGVIPTDFSFSGSTQPVGCKMMKFSGAKDNAAFGYMTETTVRGDQYGLALYSAATNIKQKTVTNFEYWLLFLKKDNNKWTTTKSYYFSMSLGTTVSRGDDQETHQQNSFYAKTPDNTEMRWSSPTTTSDTFNKFFEDSSDTSSLWDRTKDKYYVGLWMGGNGGSNEDLFYSGSNERWALKEWFGVNDKAKKEEPGLFLQKVKLTQKGKWQSIGDACASLKGKEVSSMTTEALSECIQSKALTSSPVAS